MIQVVIWGAGDRGERIIYHIGEENVRAVIDQSEKKRGTLFHGKKVICFEQYLEECSDCPIVISTHEQEIAWTLEQKGIFHYLRMDQCPEDFQSPNPRSILKDYVQSHVDKSKEYQILGVSLFSLLFLEWIEQVGGKGKLVVGKTCKEEFKHVLENVYKDRIVSYLEQFDASKEKMVCTLEENLENFVRPAYVQYVQCILRISEQIEEYHHPELERFKGIHRGKRCFIVATGPSLRAEDLDTLKKNGEYCISVNSIYRIFDQTEWRPDYYVTVDPRCWTRNREAFSHMADKICLIADSNADFCASGYTDNEKVFTYHVGYLWDETGRVPFSEDFTKTVYEIGTVVYVALQLAVYMGFEEIYLLGTDVGGASKAYQSYTHFYNEKELTSVFFAGQVNVGFCTARDYAQEHGIKILNATRGGEVEVFPRVDFDTLFCDLSN